MKAILIVALATVAVGFKIDPLEYLQKYGYLDKSQTFNGGLDDAILNFQEFAHLPPTGILDDATLAMMQQPRCGVKDVMPASFSRDVRSTGVRKKRYIATSRYRRSREVTYTFVNYNADLGKDATRRIIRQAFDMWSNVTNLVFKEVTGSRATLVIKFGSRGHGCYYAFDGPGGVLAHAFYPDQSGVHFDEDEEFTDGTHRGRNLLWVAAHEFGHSLGLPHSSVYEALMYPFYKGYVPNMKLPVDDIGAVQALYGCKKPNRNPVAVPQGSAPYDGLLMERWLNQPGNNIHHIEPDVCRYPHQPDSTAILKTFEAPENSGSDFATRIRGYYHANTTGFHYFFMCADDSAKLYLSSSVNPADKKEIIKVDRKTKKDLDSGRRGYSQGHLKAGQTYYIEAVHKDSQGDDFLKIGVQQGNGKISLITSHTVKWALPDTDIQVVVCLGRYEALICPASHRIQIVKAAYGMFFNKPIVSKARYLCNFDRWSDSSGTIRRNCAAKSSMSKVKSLCEGKQQCTLYAHDTEFPDHCGRMLYSVLDVTYRCVSGDGPVTQPPVTQPPVTQPPKTQPPKTQPPKTQPPTTQAPTTQLPTTKAKCKDTRTSCQSWADAGYCKLEHVRNQYCRKTCNVCKAGPTTQPPVTQPPKTQPPTTQAPTTQAQTTQAPTTKAICKDNHPSCKTWADAGNCRLQHIRDYYCQKSCRVCKGPEICADAPREAPDCPRWKASGKCKTHKQLRETYCRKTCGTCK